MTDPRAQKIERQIASLGGGITISNHRLRQRVLDRAADGNFVEQNRKRTAKLVVTLAALMLLVSPVVAIILRLQIPKSPDAHAVNQAALRQADQSRVSFDWALVDVFKKLRGRSQ